MLEIPSMNFGFAMRGPFVSVRPKYAITVAEIQRAVAVYFGLSVEELLSPVRGRRIARPRQIGMYLAKELGKRSTPDIGQRFGGRDHTTVIHAVRQVKRLMAEDPDVANDVRVLRRALEC